MILELVPGLTLAQPLAEGPLPVEEALRVNRQIAEALEAAHEKGIVPRDLKPANVKITPEGKVKVLDFGLAKALETSASRDANFSESPTITAQATEIGVVLGTAAYMSPEQARGRPVDKRADIWGFGCVLFESLARRRAFRGEISSDCMAQILAGEPDWNALPASTPANIRALVRRCLEKSPHKRLRDIGDAVLEIDDALARPAGAPILATPAAPSKKRVLAYAAGGLLAGAIVAARAVYSWRQTTTQQRVARFTVSFAPNELIRSSNSSQVAISRDGSRVAYSVTGEGAAGQQIYIRTIDQQEAKLLTDAGGGVPFFSPDGKWVGFAQLSGTKPSEKLRSAEARRLSLQTLELSRYKCPARGSGIGSCRTPWP